MSEKKGPGRPRKSKYPYKPEYCELLIEHMKAGYSFMSFGAVVNATVDAIQWWLQKYPEFAEAKKLAETHNLLWWEEAAKGKMDTGKWIFNMKNRFGWMDKREVHQTGSVEVKGKFDKKALIAAIGKDPFMKAIDVTPKALDAVKESDRTKLLDVNANRAMRNKEKVAAGKPTEGEVRAINKELKNG